MSIRASVHPAVAALPETMHLLRSQRILFIPLSVSAIAKLLLLLIALFAPFAPFSKVLAPFVRYFWGEIYLHYPYHLALANRWFRRADLLLPVLLEGFLMGITAYLAYQLLSGHPLKPRQAFSEAFRRYPASVMIGTLTIVSVLVAVWVALFPVKFLPRFFHQMLTQNSFAGIFLLTLITVLVAAAVEAFFIFAFPMAILNRQSWLRATARSIQMTGRSFWPIFLALGLISLTYLPFILLRHGSTRWVTGAWPESMLFVYLLRILASWAFSAFLAVWVATVLVRCASVTR